MFKGFCDIFICFSGTFDVRSINITTNESTDELYIFSTFINETRAKGVLYIFWNKKQILLERFPPYLLPLQRKIAEEGFNSMLLPQYNFDAVFAYDIEYDNKINSGLPAAETSFFGINTTIETEEYAEFIGNKYIVVVSQVKSHAMIKCSYIDSTVILLV